MSKHYLVFIHGIGEDNFYQSPSEQNEQLWHLLIQNSGMSQEQFASKFSRIDTNWHRPPLQTAAQTIHEAAFPGLKNQCLNPLTLLRNFMTFFLGDVTAYASSQVNFIRRTVWSQMWQKLETPLKNENATYSIVGHSLGSVIGFDYLFYLFKDNEVFLPDRLPEQTNLPQIHITSEEKTLLKQQFHHFFSLGSPISLFMLSQGDLWDLENPQQQFSQIYNPVRCDDGKNRVWYNFWDEKDIIAYPVANLFKKNSNNRTCILEDISVETEFLNFDPHSSYFRNSALAKYIMNALNQ